MRGVFDNYRDAIHTVMAKIPEPYRPVQKAPLKDRTLNIQSRYLLSQHRPNFVNTFVHLGLELGVPALFCNEREVGRDE